MEVGGVKLEAQNPKRHLRLIWVHAHILICIWDGAHVLLIWIQFCQHWEISHAKKMSLMARNEENPIDGAEYVGRHVIASESSIYIAKFDYLHIYLRGRKWTRASSMNRRCNVAPSSEQHNNFFFRNVSQTFEQTARLL